LAFSRLCRFSRFPVVSAVLSFVTHPPLPPILADAVVGRSSAGTLSDAPASETVLRVPVALVPLPSLVPVTGSPTSMHRSWFPPEVHIDTGRFARPVGCNPVPESRSYAALRLLVPFGDSSGLPLPLAYLDADACSLPFGRQLVRRRQVARRRFLSGSRVAVLSRGETWPPRFLGRPLPACQGRTPADAASLAYSLAGRRCCLQENSSLASGMVIVSWPLSSARTLARLRIAAGCRARRKAHYRLGGYPLPDGFRTRWTTYRIS